TKVLFDPATGKGAFYESLLKANRQHITFMGWDIDAEVLAEKIYCNSNCIIEQRDFMAAPPKQKFSAIVANPPYIRHHRIGREKKIFLRQVAQDIVGETFDGRAGYHLYFFIQALNLLDRGGKLAFIMPADICEGKYAKKLWNWIAIKFRIECVVNFDESATPFPSVDTNAMIFFIKNEPPAKTLSWVNVHESHSSDLPCFVKSGFINNHMITLTSVRRNLDEALSTGLSRTPQIEKYKFFLHDFAKIMRGIATGANDFFFLTSNQVNEFNIPNNLLVRAIGRTRDIDGDTITIEDIDSLDKKNRPTFLLSINGQSECTQSIKDYLNIGKQKRLSERPLIKQRNPWYKMEQREVPPLLFAYLGRRSVRFIKNIAGVVPLTGFLCVYPLCDNEEFIHKLWCILNHPDTLSNLRLVGKSYGSGAVKVEPTGLARLPLPTHVLKEYGMTAPISKLARYSLIP
ncbi:MAG: Eco57I restriction-modification methylase domain-containing protein, partial [Deltaproteobacteria bacterium]|nr:Eco57I restriction-modification methylase domain-containing protein [Deltaproteobacteria bacterium]